MTSHLTRKDMIEVIECSKHLKTKEALQDHLDHWEEEVEHETDKNKHETEEDEEMMMISESLDCQLGETVMDRILRDMLPVKQESIELFNLRPVLVHIMCRLLQSSMSMAQEDPKKLQRNIRNLGKTKDRQDLVHELASLGLITPSESMLLHDPRIDSHLDLKDIIVKMLLYLLSILPQQPPSILDSVVFGLSMQIADELLLKDLAAYHETEIVTEDLIKSVQLYKERLKACKDFNKTNFVVGLRAIKWLWYGRKCPKTPHEQLKITEALEMALIKKFKDERKEACNIVLNRIVEEFNSVLRF